jgi:hypothetical protein
MKCIAGTDRLLRAFTGLAILGLGLYFHTWWGAVGLFPLLVGLIGRCPNFGTSQQRFHLDRDRLASRATPPEQSGRRLG